MGLGQQLGLRRMRGSGQRLRWLDGLVESGSLVYALPELGGQFPDELVASSFIAQNYGRGRWILRRGIRGSSWWALILVGGQRDAEISSVCCHYWCSKEPSILGQGSELFSLFSFIIQPTSSYLFQVDLFHSLFVLFFCQGGVAQLCRQFFSFGSMCLLGCVIRMGEPGLCLPVLYE